jgi:hypothetical protein
VYSLNRSKKKRCFLGIFGAGLSIPLFFSSREELVHREKNSGKKAASEKMGKKHVRQPMLPWVKRGGKPRGVAHGMHLA